jgi:hypothetical protein
MGVAEPGTEAEAIEEGAGETVIRARFECDPEGGHELWR